MTARKYHPLCSFPSCDRPHNSKGLCTTHGAMSRKGQPLRAVQNRTGPLPTPAIDRFRVKTATQADGCIVWLGSTNKGGYGSFVPKTVGRVGHRVMAHRWIYEHEVGQIPQGFDIDHLCRNRSCVNPMHLEPVTRQENIRRAAQLKRRCPAGHPYTPENTYLRPGTSHRRCRACMQQQNIDRAESKNAKRRLARALKREQQRNGRV